MKINVTAEQLAACIKANEEALVHHIRDCGQSHPPADGSIGRIFQNLRALQILSGFQVQAGLAAQMATGRIIGEDDVDVGATDNGERVTVKKRIVHGRKDG